MKSQTLGGDGGDQAPRNEQDKRRAEIAKKLKEQDNAGQEKKKKKATLGACSSRPA